MSGRVGAVTLVLAVLGAACGQSRPAQVTRTSDERHAMPDAATDAPVPDERDAPAPFDAVGVGADTTPLPPDESFVPGPPDTSCPELAEAPRCIELCESGCTQSARCGAAYDDCRIGCLMEYRCPGESIGHDDAICEAEAAFVSGANEAGYCSWVANFATLPPEAERFCTWLELGARFETSEVLWCSAGWPGPDRPPTPAEDPSLYCHWSLTFREGEVSAILEDYGFTQPFTCALGGLVSFNGENGTWDAERGVLTWSGVEYVPVN